MTPLPAADDTGGALGERLRPNRRLIVGVSVISGFLGLLPVPLLGELGIDLLRAFLLRRLARRHSFELSAEATLVAIGADRTSVPRLAIGALLALGARLLWRRLTRALLVLLRFDDMGRTFLLGTFFDHYCLTHHDGAPVDRPRAERLARAITAASRRARPQVVAALFRRVLGDLGQAGVYLPRRLWSLLLTMLRDEHAPQAELVVEQDLDGFFARATKLVERELNAAGELTAQALCSAFDEAWRDAASPAPSAADTAPPPGVSDAAVGDGGATNNPDGANR